MGQSSSSRAELCFCGSTRFEYLDSMRSSGSSLLQAKYPHGVALSHLIILTIYFKRVSNDDPIQLATNKYLVSSYYVAGTFLISGYI